MLPDSTTSKFIRSRKLILLGACYFIYLCIGDTFSSFFIPRCLIETKPFIDSNKVAIWGWVSEICTVCIAKTMLFQKILKIATSIFSEFIPSNRSTFYLLKSIHNFPQFEIKYLHMQFYVFNLKKFT